MPGILLGSSVRIEASGGGACDTLRDALTGSDDAFTDFTGYSKLAVQFTAGASYTNCKIEADLFKIGTPNAGNISFSIFSDNGSDAPNAQIGTPSSTIAKSAITASFGDPTTFNGISASITNGTKYFAVAEASTLDTDGSNCIVWINNGGSAPAYGWNGSSWEFIGNLNFHVSLFST